VRLIERVWFGDSAVDQAGRVLLSPLEIVYRGAVQLRSELYDSGVMKTEHAAIPVVSIGNLTVGGTGKTPVAAWIASRLAALGKSPAIVLRGYGGDEPLVHARLNPSVPVIVNADRNAGIRDAAAAGADVVVLDDAFQHRRAGRDADVVLVSADDWTRRQHLLPAGPYREPLSAIRRASLVVITRKSASDAKVEAAGNGIREAAPDLPTAVITLSPSEIVSTGGSEARLPVSALAGKSVTAVAAIGNPDAFFRQLEACGARVTRLAFPDHHSFSPADISAILRASEGGNYVLCTLKDAVKLEPLWPAGKSPLWYVSLAVNVEHGGAVIDEMLERLGRHEGT
jgi:tetraacyldisaccharide 4'-kinase